MATKMELELSAPMGMTVHRFLPFGVKNASLGRDSFSSSICQKPESWSTEMYHLACGPISDTASSQRRMGKANGLVIWFKRR